MKIFLTLILILLPIVHAVSQKPAGRQPIVNVRSAPTLRLNGLQFKDLNKNGKLEVYEDWRRPNQERVKDLIAQMTLAEKAGMMMHGTARASGPMGVIGAGSAYDLEQIRKLISEAKIRVE